MKSLSVDVLSRSATRNLAHTGIDRDVHAFYSEKYPDVATSRADDVARLVGGLKAIYDQNVFPMHVELEAYPSNIGHRNWPGCFRCHDGKHVSADGQVLASACDTCHTLPQRGPRTKLQARR